MIILSKHMQHKHFKAADSINNMPVLTRYSFVHI